MPGNWKLFLDHRYAFKGEAHPQELYNLQADQKETKNLLAEEAGCDKHREVVDFLLEQAKRARGDGGSTRQLEK